MSHPIRKILFVLKDRHQYGSYGYVSYGLLNSASFVAIELEKFPGVETKVVSVIDGNSIDREVYAYKPTHVIIEALWATPTKMAELMNRYPLIKWIVRLHSKPTFLANEGIAFEWIGDLVELSKATGMLTVSTNNEEFSRYLSSIYNVEFSYSPNIYPEPFRFHVRKFPEAAIIHIGLFGALRPMKNHVTQAIAAIDFAKSIGKYLKFHINSDRVEQRGGEVLKNLRALFADMPNAELVEHPWVDHGDFIKLVGEMDLGLQVSVSETYNIVAADFVSMGIPILVCPDIEFTPSVYQVNPTSLDAIKQGLLTLYTLDNPVLTFYAKWRLAQSNKRAVKAWRQVIV